MSQVTPTKTQNYRLENLKLKLIDTVRCFWCFLGSGESSSGFKGPERLRCYHLFFFTQTNLMKLLPNSDSDGDRRYLSLLNISKDIVLGN